MIKRWVGLSGGFVLVLLVLLFVMPVPSAAQGEDWRCVEINGTLALNIRSGPGVSYDVVVALAAGAQMEADYAAVTSADGYNWLPVRFPDGRTGGEGWAITARLLPCPDTGAAGGESSSDETVVLEGVNRDGTLDRFEIEQVAHSVVLIANMRGSRIRATGTGTITTPDGLIVTNAHVVEGADRVALGILDDINDPPEYLYIGEVVSLDDEIDVALIAIRFDMDGQPVDAADLALPYIPATLTATDVFRGDSIYIFGYPGIGDDYLVVTTGSIVSVENGEINGQRMPMWYRTDAEIAPGNSGGLVVNGNGEFVGIPTFVQIEDETGGRLGGIRPAEVALMAVLDEEYGPLNTVTSASIMQGVEINLQAVRLDHGTVLDEQAGIAFHIAFTINGWAEQDATLSAQVYHDDLAGLPVINKEAPAHYRDQEGAVRTVTPFFPCCEKTVYEDLSLFLPYETFGFTAAGTYPLKFEIAITAGDGSWRRVLGWEFVTYTRG